MPVHAPLHPAKAEFGPATGVRVTTSPAPKVTEQVPGQLIPLGLLVTVPVALPVSETVVDREKPALELPTVPDNAMLNVGLAASVVLIVSVPLTGLAVALAAGASSTVMEHVPSGAMLGVALHWF